MSVEVKDGSVVGVNVQVLVGIKVAVAVGIAVWVGTRVDVGEGRVVEVGSGVVVGALVLVLWGIVGAWVGTSLGVSVGGTGT